MSARLPPISLSNPMAVKSSLPTSIPTLSLRSTPGTTPLQASTDAIGNRPSRAITSGWSKEEQSFLTTTISGSRTSALEPASLYAIDDGRVVSCRPHRIAPGCPGLFRGRASPAGRQLRLSRSLGNPHDQQGWPFARHAASFMPACQPNDIVVKGLPSKIKTVDSSETRWV